MDVVDVWTGARAVALCDASRMTYEEFAEKLGRGVSTVHYWRSHPNARVRKDIAGELDVMLERASAHAQALFWQTIRKEAPHTGDGVDALAEAGSDATQDPAATGVNYRAGEVDAEVAASHRAWLDTRRALNHNRATLTHIASQLYPSGARLGGTRILAPEHWRLDSPVDLDAIRLVWRDDVPPPTVCGQEAETRALRPLHSNGRQYTRYHRAMHDLDRPRLFENRLCYRLVNVGRPGSSDRDQLSLALTLGNMC